MITSAGYMYTCVVNYSWRAQAIDIRCVRLDILGASVIAGYVNSGMECILSVCAYTRFSAAMQHSKLCQVQVGTKLTATITCNFKLYITIIAQWHILIQSLLYSKGISRLQHAGSSDTYVGIKNISAIQIKDTIIALRRYIGTTKGRVQ